MTQRVHRCVADRRTARVSLALVCLACTAVADVAALQRRAIKTHTRTLKRSRDVAARRKAAQSLGQMPTPDVVPALITALGDPEVSVRRAAAGGLWNIGKHAASATEALHRALQDPGPGVRIRASWALQNMGGPAAELADARRFVLRYGDLYGRFWAAYGLIGFEPPPTLIGPILEYVRSRSDTEAGGKALKQLAGTQDRTLIAPMTDVVQTFSPASVLILRALNLFEPKPDRFVSLLVKQLAFEDKRLTLEVLAILRGMPVTDQHVQTWLKPVIPLAEHPDDGVRSMAVSLLGAAEGRAHEGIETLIRVLSDDADRRVRRAAADAMGRIGDRRKPFPAQTKQRVAVLAFPRLSHAVAYDPDPNVRVAAIRSLAMLQLDTAQIVPLLTRVARTDGSTAVSLAATQALGARGPEAKPALAALRAMNSHPDPRVRRSANDAIRRIESGSPAAPALGAPRQQGATSPRREQALAALRTEGTTFDEHAFARALTRADKTKVQAFLESGVSADYQFKSRHNQPALSMLVDSMIACNPRKRPTAARTKELVRLLLAKGADPNLTDKRGNTPLMMAASKCDAELIQLLLDAGADPNAKNQAGLVALEFSLMFANDGADALIRAGARLPKDKIAMYEKTYAGRPQALGIIRRAAGK